NFTSVKTKYDELMLANITTNNEKSRAKGQLEEYRLKEQALHREMAELSARYDETKKTLDLLQGEKNDLLRNIQILQAANTELVGQNHSLSAKYAESLKAIHEQKQFITDAQ